MTETKTEIAVYRGPDGAGLTARGKPVTARNAPASEGVGRPRRNGRPRVLATRPARRRPVRLTARTDRPGNRSPSA